MQRSIVPVVLAGLCFNVHATIPDIMAAYLADEAGVTFKEIASEKDQVLIPRDLDFDLKGNLWIVNKGTEASGSSTVTLTNPGLPTQKAAYKKDQNAWHFMNLTSALAFGDNGNFATAPGVLDANHQSKTGGFTGPTLWNSDTAIYAVKNSGNGSHIDMLHTSPYSMGIAHEKDNAYWVFDAFNNDVVRYDFATPHQPGGSDHSDGMVRVFPEVVVKWINQDIPCHLVVQKSKGMLYIVDGGNKRILRLDIRSGIPGGVPKYPSSEKIREYTNMSGAKWEVVTGEGLFQPSGIDVVDNHMVVSDYGTGDLILFDITTLPARELGRIATGSKGVMGLVIGPTGRIWYVNGITSKVMMAEPKPLSASGRLFSLDSDDPVRVEIIARNGTFSIRTEGFDLTRLKARIMDTRGRILLSRTGFLSVGITVDAGSFVKGLYFLVLNDGKRNAVKNLPVGY